MLQPLDNLDGIVNEIEFLQTTEAVQPSNSSKSIALHTQHLQLPQCTQVLREIIANLMTISYKYKIKSNLYFRYFVLPYIQFLQIDQSVQSFNNLAK